MRCHPTLCALTLVTFTAFAALVGGCGRPDAPASEPAASELTPTAPAASAAPRAGTVTGRVTDAAGKPLRNVTVHVYGTTMAGENTRFEINPGPDGRYAQRLPDGIYGVRAEYTLHTPDGNTVVLALHPADGVTGKHHDAAKGIVKDFQWRIDGLRPDQSPGVDGTHNEPFKYYGGSLQVQVQETAGSKPLPQGSTLSVTLTPAGPLLDGSQGRSVTRSRTFSPKLYSSSYWYPSDIPLGSYTAVFRYKSADGKVEALQARKDLDTGAGFTDTLSLDIVPAPNTNSALPIQVTVTPPATP
jgi:hypothetical protein